jgi:hypothetical protein
MAVSRGQGEPPPGERAEPSSTAAARRAAPQAGAGRRPVPGPGFSDPARRPARPPGAASRPPSRSSRGDRPVPGYRPGPLSGWGTRPGRLGPVLIILGALAGLILTVLAGLGPGALLGLIVIVATVAGGSAVRQDSTYLIIPFPAPAYFVAAVIAGLIHDSALDTSTTGLALNFTQWIAGGFLWMCAATVVAIAITIIRWLATGQAAYRWGGAWNSGKYGGGLRGFRGSSPGPAQSAPRARSTIARSTDGTGPGDARRDPPLRSGRLDRDGTDV